MKKFSPIEFDVLVPPRPTRLLRRLRAKYSSSPFFQKFVRFALLFLCFGYGFSVLWFCLFLGADRP